MTLATLPLSASPSAAAGSPTAACGPDEVTVVVDFNELGGATGVECVADGGTAAELFEEAGFPLTYAAAPGMQGFVCTVGGRPGKGPCTEGDSYWSLWWSAGPDEWAYATLGATQLEVGPGGYVGFAWHQGDADAAPPDVALDGEAPSDEQVVQGGPDVATEDPPARSVVPTWALAGGAVLVLGAALAVPLLRRRSR